MTEQLPATGAETGPGVLEALVPRPMLFADEDPATYRDLRDALMIDLAPVTPYERMIAENLVTLEWEMIRHRRMRDNLIKTQVRQLAINVFVNGKMRDFGSARVEPEHRHLANALVSGNQDLAFKGTSALYKHNVTPSELFAEAYAQAARHVEVHEKKLAELEHRRRRLREDYDRLKAARRKPVEDAEIVA